MKYMTNEQKDEYIKILEKENKQLKKEKIDSNKIPELPVLLKAQEDFLLHHYYEKDNLIMENKRLNLEISRLTRTIMMDNNYINYLLNSFWWKMSYPFRVISRRIRKKIERTDYKFVENFDKKQKFEPIKEKVSIIVFTYNAGEEFSVQLKNFKKQKLIEDLEIIVIDKGSTDYTLKHAKDAKAKIVLLDNPKLSDDEIYNRCLPRINGEYLVFTDQNKIIDSKYWIYQAIRPIKENRAVSTAFFKEDVSFIKYSTYYQELKERMNNIAEEQVLFFPENRDVIQYFSPYLLDKTHTLVKKKVSNMFLI